MTYARLVSFRSAAILVAAVALLGSDRRAFAADNAAAGPVVELPKIVVTDSRALPPPESWRYAQVPGCEVLSNASDRTTRRLISDFQLFRQALDIVWPMPVEVNTPVLVILCGKGNQFRSFVPDKADGGPETAMASVHLNGRTRSAIVIDVESTVINLLPTEDDTDMGIDATRFAIEHNKQLYREYVMYLLGRAQPRLPAWFEEGMAQIVMAMRFDPKYIEFGRIRPANEVSVDAAMRNEMNASLAAATGMANETVGDPATATDPVVGGAPLEDRDFNAVLQHRALMPMGELLAVSRDSPIALNPLGTNTWAKQCYAFVHMCLFSEKGRLQKPFAEFLIRSTREPVTEALFRDCFKMSYREMNLELRGYIQGPAYDIQTYQGKGGKPILTETKVDLRDATPGEVGRIKGEAKLLAGHVEDARTEFIAPYLRGDRDPQLLAQLGLLEHATGKDDRARKFLAAAVDGKTTDPDAYLELARMEYAQALGVGPAQKSVLSAAESTALVKLLLVARTLPPPRPATYELLADVYAHSSSRPTHDTLVPLIEGVRLFPNDLRLVYEAASLCVDARLPDAAQSLIDHGLKLAEEPKARHAFEQLKAALPAPAPTAPATPATPAPAAVPAKTAG